MRQYAEMTAASIRVPVAEVGRAVNTLLDETPDEEACGLPHYDYPESRCAEPSGRHDRDEGGDIHGAPLIVDGEECGAVAWTDREADRA